MEVKINVVNEESRKREDTTMHLSRERVQTQEQISRDELTQLDLHHAQLLQLQQEKSAIQLAEPDRRAKEAEKKTQEAQEARVKLCRPE